MRWACLTAVLLAGLMGISPQLCAHGNENLFARVSPGDGGEITVEVTADVAGNALIVDEADARRILTDALMVQFDGHDHALATLGPLTFERRTRYSDDAPIPSQGNLTPHQLLTVIWHARLPGRTVRFVTPVHTAFDVVLWNTAEIIPQGQSRWMLLICGETSRSYTLSSASELTMVLVCGGALTLVLTVIGVGLLRQRRRNEHAHSDHNNAQLSNLT